MANAYTKPKNANIFLRLWGYIQKKAAKAAYFSNLG
jgi:hypothetical protein